MEYRNLGTAGVKVSRICLGTAFRGQEDEKVRTHVIHRAIDLGCNFIDCANYYGRGKSETILGRALEGRRDDIVLTSKACSPMGGGPNDRGLSRFHIMREVEGSLRRLRTDHLDIYLLHAFDPNTPLEETLRAMDDLVHQGKTRYVGCCNFDGWRVVEALWASDVHNLTRFVCIQSPYNLLGREPMESDLMPVCRQFGLGIMGYSPLCIGLLTGRFRRGKTPPAGTPWAKGNLDFEKRMDAQADAVVEKLIDIGRERGKTPAQVAIAWILDHGELSAPIIGPDLPEHVDEVFGALDLELAPEERAALDEISARGRGHA